MYKRQTFSKVWPVCWKLEFVTVIPKTTNPADLSGLRNISCTVLASKIYESYVLNWAQEEVKVRSNQYGGVRGCSTAHMLLDVFQDVGEDLEDCRAATVITAIDFAKAFNRLSYQHCLRAFAEHGASAGIIRLIATFLTNRVMTVRVGSTWSDEKPVTGGCPQGSILGVFLFNVTVDDLEAEEREALEGTVTDEEGLEANDSCALGSGSGSPPGHGGERSALESLDDNTSGGVRTPGASVVGDGLIGGGQLQPQRCSTPAGLEAVGLDACWSDLKVGCHVGDQIELLPNLREVARRRLFDAAPLPIPVEPHPRTHAKWKDRPAKVYKYVDDAVIVCLLYTSDAADE